jgi:hypothetical protein
MFQWGGDGEVTFEVREPAGAIAVDYPLPGSLWTRKRILFGRKLKAAERIRLAYTRLGVAREKPDAPYISLSPDDRYLPGAAIALAATFENGSGAQLVWFQEQTADVVPPNWVSERRGVDYGTRYDYPRVIKPGRRYCICWEFDSTAVKTLAG